jgi:hypothetical protein
VKPLASTRLEKRSASTTDPAAGRDGSQRARAILVTGMHRSGTSAVTRVLGLLGLDLPNALLPPAEDNPLGYWEPQDVVGAHDRFLGEFGSAYDDVVGVRQAALASHAARELEQRLTEILKREFGDSAAFVVKDPRICRLVPIWVSVLERFGADPSFVVPIRNPLEVAGSLEARNLFSPAKSLLLWLRHNLEAEHATRAHPRSVVSYEDMLADWRPVVDKIAADLSLAWPRESQNATAAIDGFLSPRERHHAVDLEGLRANADVADWVKDTYEVLLAATRGADVDTERLDAIRAEVERADLAYAPLIGEREQELASRDEELASRTAELDTLRRELAETEREIEARDRNLDRARADLKRLRRDLDDRSRALAGADARLESREALLAEREQELASRDEDSRALAVADARLESREALLAERTAVVAAKDQTIAMLGQALEAPAPALPVAEPLAEPPATSAEPAPAAGRASSLRRLYRSLRNVLAWLILPSRRRLRPYSTHRKLRGSPLFDAEYYLAQHPDVRSAGFDPLMHYILYGAAEGRDPSASFSTRAYLVEHPDLLQRGVNPLLDFATGAVTDGPRAAADPETQVKKQSARRAVPAAAAPGPASRGRRPSPATDFSDIVVLLARERAGATALGAVLESHPEVFSLGEVFGAGRGSDRRLARDASFLSFRARHVESDPELGLPERYEELFVDFFEYLRGFSPSRYLLVDVPYDATELLAQPKARGDAPCLYEPLKRHNVRVLNLRGANPLPGLVEGRAANADGATTVEPESLTAELDRCAAEDREIESAFAGYANFRAYDVGDVFPRRGIAEPILAAIAEWLDVPVSFPGTGRLETASSVALAEEIANWPEIEAALRDTKYDRYLEAEPSYPVVVEPARGTRPRTAATVRSAPLRPEHAALVEKLWHSRPDWIEGSLPMSDTNYVFATVFEAGIGSVVEIGTASGFSTAVICHALRCAHEAGSIDDDYSVASFDIDDRLYFARDRFAGDAAREMLPLDLLRRVTFRAPATALDFPEHFVEDEIELMFLDADHSHPWPALDLLATLDYLKPGAVVILHDINLPLIRPDIPGWGVKHLFETLDVEKELAPDDPPNIGRIVIPDDKEELRSELHEIVQRHHWEEVVPEKYTAALLD